VLVPVPDDKTGLIASAEADYSLKCDLITAKAKYLLEQERKLTEMELDLKAREEVVFWKEAFLTKANIKLFRGVNQSIINHPPVVLPVPGNGPGSLAEYSPSNAISIAVETPDQRRNIPTQQHVNRAQEMENNQMDAIAEHRQRTSTEKVVTSASQLEQSLLEDHRRQQAAILEQHKSQIALLEQQQMAITLELQKRQAGLRNTVTSPTDTDVSKMSFLQRANVHGSYRQPSPPYSNNASSLGRIKPSSPPLAQPVSMIPMRMPFPPCSPPPFFPSVMTSRLSSDQFNQLRNQAGCGPRSDVQRIDDDPRLRRSPSPLTLETFPPTFQTGLTPRVNPEINDFASFNPRERFVKRSADVELGSIQMKHLPEIAYVNEMQSPGRPGESFSDGSSSEQFALDPVEHWRRELQPPGENFAINRRLADIDADDLGHSQDHIMNVRKRGRPKGSKNRSKMMRMTDEMNLEMNRGIPPLINISTIDVEQRAQDSTMNYPVPADTLRSATNQYSTYGSRLSIPKLLANVEVIHHTPQPLLRTFKNATNQFGGIQHIGGGIDSELLMSRYREGILTSDLSSDLYHTASNRILPPITSAINVRTVSALRNVTSQSSSGSLQTSNPTVEKSSHRITDTMSAKVRRLLASAERSVPSVIPPLSPSPLPYVLPQRNAKRFQVEKMKWHAEHRGLEVVEQCGGGDSYRRRSDTPRLVVDLDADDSSDEKMKESYSRSYSSSYSQKQNNADFYAPQSNGEELSRSAAANHIEGMKSFVFGKFKGSEML